MLRKINQPAIWLGLGLVVIIAITAYVVTTGSGDKTTLAAGKESSTGPDVTEQPSTPASVEKSPLNRGTTRLSKTIKRAVFGRTQDRLQQPSEQ